MKRRTWLGLIAVAAVAAVGGAAAITGAWAHGAGGPWGRHGSMMKRMVSAALDEALDQAAVTPEQRLSIHAVRDRVFAAVEAQGSDHLARREQMLALFEGDHLDPGQLEALHAQGEARREAMHNAIAQAVVEIHDVLDPAQRRAMAAFVRSRGPGARR